MMENIDDDDDEVFLSDDDSDHGDQFDEYDLSTTSTIITPPKTFHHAPILSGSQLPPSGQND